ncbi:MAG: hypothetical protein ABIH37_01890 [archaeon]
MVKIKNINIKLDNKIYYLLALVLVVIIINGIVVAYNSGASPSVMGHSLNEIELPSCTDGQVLKYTDVSGWGCGDEISGSSENDLPGTLCGWASQFSSCVSNILCNGYNVCSGCPPGYTRKKQSGMVINSWTGDYHCYKV